MYARFKTEAHKQAISKTMQRKYNICELAIAVVKARRDPTLRDKCWKGLIELVENLMQDSFDEQELQE